MESPTAFVITRDTTVRTAGLGMTGVLPMAPVDGLRCAACAHALAGPGLRTAGRDQHRAAGVGAFAIRLMLYKI